MSALPPHARQHPPAPYPWKPVALWWISLAWHAMVFTLWVAAPGLWKWWLAMLILQHMLISLLVMWPRNRLSGRVITRLPAAAAQQGLVALTIDDGPDPAVTPQVLDVLDTWGARATFFCIGQRAARHPEIVRAILARGHAVENHGHTHSAWFSLWGTRRMEQDIRQAQEALWSAAGAWPRHFRPTAGFRNPWTDLVLARTGLHAVHWTRRGFDTRDPDPARVLRRLCHRLAGGDILLLHDGHCATTPAGEPVILAVLPGLLAQMRQQGLRTVRLEDVVLTGEGGRDAGAFS